MFQSVACSQIEAAQTILGTQQAWSDLAPVTLSKNNMQTVNSSQRHLGKTFFLSSQSAKIIVNVTECTKVKSIQECFGIAFVGLKSFTIPFVRNEENLWGAKLILSESMVLSWK